MNNRTVMCSSADRDDFHMWVLHFPRSDAANEMYSVAVHDELSITSACKAQFKDDAK